MAEYNIGDKRRLTATFKDINDVLTDPTDITFLMKEPDGTKTTHLSGGGIVTASSTGVWYVDWTVTQEGIHNYEFKGTGAVVTAEESSFRVRRRAVA
jgi:hypothetical protein